MRTLVSASGVAPDTWVRAEELDPASGRPERLIVPLAEWLRDPVAARARADFVGVRVAPDTAWTVLAPFVTQLALIAIEFPSVGEGRGYSLAHQLRGRAGFKGELRAVGQIFRDHALFLARCGFSSFEHADKESAEDVYRGLKNFTVAYQPASAQPLALRQRTF
jgi:uncharacterized protein (DUF934 family)